MICHFDTDLNCWLASGLGPAGDWINVTDEHRVIAINKWIERAEEQEAQERAMANFYSFKNGYGEIIDCRPENYGAMTHGE